MNAPLPEPHAPAAMKPSEDRATKLEIPVREDDDTLLERMREVHRLLTRHPRVTRAVISAFVTEGRAYARTLEGRRLRDALLGSERLRRARLLWSAFGLEHYAARTSSFEPSQLLGMLVAATASPHLEELLTRLAMKQGDEHA
jgi:hypothetical protein